MDKTFLKGLTLLETLAVANKPCGVTELAGMLDLTKSNVHRLLQGLVFLGFARKVGDNGQYELTMKLWELGAHVFGRLDVRRLAQPAMEALARETSETIHLSMLEGLDVLYLAKIDSPQPVRAYTNIGGRAPAQCVATGKAQLAWAGEAVLQRIKDDLKPYTPTSIVDATTLDAEMASIREQGYAVNRGEWREQVYGLAAPIRDGTGRVTAAIGVSGPMERLKARTLRTYAPIVTQAARDISRLLGAHSA